jgi:hypothetical protein
MIDQNEPFWPMTSASILARVKLAGAIQHKSSKHPSPGQIVMRSRPLKLRSGLNETRVPPASAREGESIDLQWER